MIGKIYGGARVATSGYERRGFGVINGTDEATSNRMMVEYPFTLYSDIEIRPILDGDVALGQWREVMSQLMGGDGGVVRPQHGRTSGPARSRIAEQQHFQNATGRARRPLRVDKSPFLSPIGRCHLYCNPCPINFELSRG